MLVVVVVMVVVGTEIVWKKEDSEKRLNISVRVYNFKD